MPLQKSLQIRSKYNKKVEKEAGAIVGKKQMPHERPETTLFFLVTE